jgi:cytochrome oxidase Cu insertion factor (SCO1/SenC/PrrC family)
MSLETRLLALRTGAAARIPADKRAIMAKATSDQRASGMLDHTIKVGAKLPPFALANQAGETVTSAALLAKGPVVLTVFRGVW